MVKKELKRGDVVRRSIRGARGFFYPDLEGRAIMVRTDCTIEVQTGWNSSSNFIAYSAPVEAFSEKDRYDPTAVKMVVWIQSDG